MPSVIKLKDYEQVVYNVLEDEKNFLEYLEENQNKILEMDFSHLEYAPNNKISDKSQEEIINYFEEVANIPINENENSFERNLHLVITYSFYYLRSGISYMDIVQEGNIGLFMAIESFGNRDKILFDNYKNFWIIRSIILYIKNELLDKKNNFIKFFNEEEKRLANLELNKASKDVTIDEIRDFLENDKEGKNIDSLESLENKKNLILSNLDFFKSKNLLNEKEIKVLTLYFGFGVEKRYSIYEIDKDLGFTENQSEELFQNALLKLSQ
ncbi:sigma factor [Fusobacterium sp. PH5-44]|uniref:sigma factor n=1 Tax=unclassified Fusobacterium TaxID=2648384 RepID=UPI003D228DD9